MDAKINLFLLACLLPFALCQQLAPGQLKQKVDEIAKAYAEGYKAAINAIRARNMIPRQSAVINAKPQINPRSLIPKPAGHQVIRNVPASYGNGFMMPARQITVNGVEKSGIPRPQYRGQFMQPQNHITRPVGHTVVERSAAPPPLLGKFMEQQRGKASLAQIQKKSELPEHKGRSQPDESKAEEMARLNAAARHRNVYFDAMGGDPYGGASGVLSHQSVHLLRSRRSAPAKRLMHYLRRHRRSRMPYLGQDLDKLGIVRAVPVMNGPANKQESVLPSFMKVHAAEFGSFRDQQNSVPEAPQYQQTLSTFR